jgi:hypothetical protein
MKNVKMALKGRKLTIEVDLDQEYGKSASGKSIIIASTEGNVDIDGADGVKIGLNVYKKA